MPRYIRQKDRFSCGPVCVLNVFKFQGEPVSYQGDYPIWRKACQCGRKRKGRSLMGTPTKRWLTIMRKIGVKRLLSPNMRKMHKKLEQGFALTVMVRYTRTQAHVFLITKTRKNAFYCVNVYKDATAGWMTKKRFYREQKKHCTEFKVWSVPKEFSCP